MKDNGANAKAVASSDVGTTVAALCREAQPQDLSDLGNSGLKVTIATGDECDTRPFCAPGLKKTYGIDISGIDPEGVGTTWAKQAARNGVDQVVLTITSTDDLVELNRKADAERQKEADVAKGYPRTMGLVK